ncbi:endoglucanase [Methanobrevibacter sp.]|uniref:endoglucanase n=1 Tax=Methanobrevibacter sp. TaxID=66852 RepID=UPI00388EDF39
MSDDREKLINVMKNLESDYKSGKISAEKYSYFRSKYEDKLNSIDAKAATKRIRSMQGKPSSPQNKRKKRPTKNKKKEEQDLVQKYIINPKKSDAKYNKKQKSGMDSGTFKLLLLLILVIGFTAGTAYGIFNLDFGSISNAESVAVVSDTAFPEIHQNIVPNKTAYNYTSYNTDDSYDTYTVQEVETTTHTSTDSSSSSDSSSHDSGGQSDQQDVTPSGDDSGGSDDGGGSDDK